MTAWSKTAPEKAGWYWARTPGEQDEVVERTSDRRWEYDLELKTSEFMRIPTPEAIEMAREALEGAIDVLSRRTHDAERTDCIEECRAALQAIGGGK